MQFARRKVLLVTESDGFFGQDTYPWQSLDTELISKELSGAFDVTRATWTQISSGKIAPQGAIIVHSSSQQEAYKSFIDDLLLYLLQSGNLLVPSINSTRSHENKGYQELHKRSVGIDSLGGVYACKSKELADVSLSYPLVFKEVSGYGSSGVRLVGTDEELGAAANISPYNVRVGEVPTRIRRLIGKVARWALGRRAWREPSGSYHDPLKRFVLQPFVPGLDRDYKVIAFRGKAFVLKRSVPEGDFRASGSGLFEFVDSQPGLLDYAQSLLESFNEPYMSFDIVERDGIHYLIEFQGVHFGPYTVKNAQYYFIKRSDKWLTEANREPIEVHMVESIISYINGHLSP